MRVRLMMCMFLFTLSFVCTSALGDDHTNGEEIHFRAKWDGRVILGISKISGLKRVTKAIEHRSSAQSNQVRYSPGISRYVPIVIERPRTHDNAFEQRIRGTVMTKCISMRLKV